MIRSERALNLTAIALFIDRIALRAFFTVSGFHKLSNRHVIGVCA